MKFDGGLSKAELEKSGRRLDALLDAQQRKNRTVEDIGTFAKGVSSRTYRDRRLKAAMPFVLKCIELSDRAGGKPFDAYPCNLARELGVTARTITRWQNIARDCEMVHTIARRGRSRPNHYTVLPAARPQPFDGSPRGGRRKKKSDKNVRLLPSELIPDVPSGLNSSSPPVPLPASGKGVCGPPPASAADQAARASTRNRPTASVSRAPTPSVPAEPAPFPRAALSARGQKATPAPPARASPSKRARQGASAISPRAPP